MSLLDDIARARAAMRSGGPDEPTGLALAAMLPSVEELADKIMVLDPDMDEAEALELGLVAREAALNALEEVLITRKEG